MVGGRLSKSLTGFQNGFNTNFPLNWVNSVEPLLGVTDFPLTLARWPMASEHCWQTSDFLSYWPRLASGISKIVEKSKKERKTKLFLFYVTSYLPLSI